MTEVFFLFATASRPALGAPSSGIKGPELQTVHSTPHNSFKRAYSPVLRPADTPPWYTRGRDDCAVFGAKLKPG